MARPGEDVTLVAIDAGRGLQERLYSMGLVPGVRMKMLNSARQRGPLMVLAKETRLALGYGAARKILVGSKIF
jgi:ferrous iron transport protein A